MTYPLNISQTYYIVDNFYTNPDEIRNFILNMQREKESGGNYAGVMTEESFLTKEHLNVISKLVGDSVKPSTQLCGKFRFSKEDDIFKQDIHFDPGKNDCAWAGVCYLTPDVDTEGTIFWKHNRTRLESIPLTLEGLDVHGFDPSKLQEFLETEGMDYSLWTKTMTIPFKYNRLVLFRPWMFHSPGKSFGNTIETSRLIQTFFFSIS